MKEKRLTHIFKLPLKLENELLNFGATLPVIQSFMIDDKILDTKTIREPLILISTFPNINTKVCSLQTQHLVSYCKNQHIYLLHISAGSYDEAHKWCLTHQESIHYYSDPQGIYLRKLGLYLPALKSATRAVLLFDENQELIYREISDPLSQEPSIKKLDAFIKGRK